MPKILGGVKIIGGPPIPYNAGAPEVELGHSSTYFWTQTRRQTSLDRITSDNIRTFLTLLYGFTLKVGLSILGRIAVLLT